MSFVLDRIAKEYGSGSTKTIALAGVSLAARPAEFLSIVGPSGCGKTTLLKILAGLITPSSGTLTFTESEERPIFATSKHPVTPSEVEEPGARVAARNVVTERRRDVNPASPAHPGPSTSLGTSTGKLPTALVFQDHGLLPWYDVLENVALGLRFQHVPRAVARERARHFIEQVGLGAFQHHRPHQLSIGMRQRVGIARAFVADPEILLLDEPFGSLDAQTRLVLQQELLRIWQEHRRVVVHVTHDIDEAILLSDRIAVMSGRPGMIREELPVPFARPRTLDVLATAEAVALRRRVWSILEEEVRESLAVPK